MQQDTGLDIKAIRADGGLVANSFMCQTLADFVQAQIDIPEISESTALGATLFFWSRVAHAIVYTVGIPWLRTVAFFGGFVGQVMIFIAIIGM